MGRGVGFRLSRRPNGQAQSSARNFIFDREAPENRWFSGALLLQIRLQTGETIYPIRKVKAGEVEEALALALEVFLQVEAPDYVPQGTAAFKRDIVETEEFIGNCRRGICPIYAAFDGEKNRWSNGDARRQNAYQFGLCEKGVSAPGYRDSPVQLSFGGHPKGEPVPSGDHVACFPFGKGFYLHIGFAPLSEEQEVDGIRFTPMKYVVR